MTGTAITADPVDDVGLLWDRMMLSAPSAARDPVPIVAPAGLRGVLRLFEAAAAGSLTGGPSAPSAGGLYPYEHYAVVAAEDGAAVYAVEPVRRICRLVRTGPRVSQALEDSGAGLPAAGDALVLTVIRPWLSMRKYGDRGYLYVQLDAAHLVTHLLCLAPQAYRRGVLRTRIHPRPLADLLDLDANCRFLHSVLALNSTLAPPDHTDPAAWTCVDARQAAPAADGSWLEHECWNELGGQFTAPDGFGRQQAQYLLPDLAFPPQPHGFPGAHSWSELAARRRSTKRFAPSTLSAADIDAVLAVLHTPLAAELMTGTALAATLVARRLADRTPHVRPLCGPAAPADPARYVDEDDLVRACMGQEHLRDAGALVLVHIPRRDLLRHGLHGVNDALLRAGALGHLLYLSAAGAGVAITGVGGFDASRWRSLAGLPEEHEMLYVILLGRPHTAAVKLDRLQPAYAHNER